MGVNGELASPSRLFCDFTMYPDDGADDGADPKVRLSV